MQTSLWSLALRKGGDRMTKWRDGAGSGFKLDPVQPYEPSLACGFADPGPDTTQRRPTWFSSTLPEAFGPKGAASQGSLQNRN